MEKKIKHNQKTRKIMIIFAIIMFVALAVVLIIAISKSKNTNTNKATSQKNTDTDKWQEGTITYNGKSYQYNHAVKTYLFMGIDKDEKVSKAKDGISGGQSDSLFLLVVDKDKKSMSVIALNRNAMTTLDIYDKEGKYLGQEEGQICLQHGYGDGMKTSCIRSVDAVSRLFYNLPIQGYVSLNMGALTKLNDVVGGVEVEVMQSLKDSRFGVDLKEGEVVTLTGEEAYVYLRSRDINEFDSSSMRLERQIQYISQFCSKAKQKVKDDISFTTVIYEAMEEYMVTNLQIADLMTEIEDYDFNQEQMYTVPGKTVMGEQFEEFYVDDEELYKMIINIFYKSTEQ